MENEITSLPKEYCDLVPVFEADEADKLPPHQKTDCTIKLLPDYRLPKGKLYSMNPNKREELHKFIDKNLERGFIHLTNSPHTAPILFQKKKKGSLQLCTNYRGLNAIMISNTYPVLLIRNLLGAAAKGKIFSKPDLQDAYFRV